MKRHSLSLILHPYKNALHPVDRIREALATFAHEVLSLCESTKGFRVNITIPAYMLLYMDPLLLGRFRELQKEERLEWLLPGFTEPFAGFSPRHLTKANISEGIQTIYELTGSKPCGYVPPFSNWEPSCVDLLRECGMQYSVLCRSLFPAETRHFCGYWITENGGLTMPLFPATVLGHSNYPDDIPAFIEQAFARDPEADTSTRFLAFDCLIPLIAEEGDPYEWIRLLGRAIPELSEKYRFIGVSEYLSMAYPQGLQFIPPSLALKRSGEEPDITFLKDLHSYDQVGIMQRKMMDISETLLARKAKKDTSKLQRDLFPAQDINRFLPKRGSGFGMLRDRHWTYAKLISIEKRLLGRKGGGQIRIAEYLRNGTKSLILSNNPLGVFIDHKNGGQVFEIDYRDRLTNICAAFNPQPRDVTRLIVPSHSRTCFADHFLPLGSEAKRLTNGDIKQIGDFISGQYDYTIQKTEKSVKAILSRHGALSFNKKPRALHMEKVFGLTGNTSELSFVYQLANPSVVAHEFLFACELNFSLPGALSNQAKLVWERKSVHSLSDSEIVEIEDLTAWRLVDKEFGVSIHFSTQKPVTIWCYPTQPPEKETSDYQGTTLIISSPVTLGENGVWTLMGKLTMKKSMSKWDPENEI